MKDFLNNGKLSVVVCLSIEFVLIATSTYMLYLN